MGENRPAVSDNDRIKVWAAAAGRCTFCNRRVLESEDLGELVPIGELAHAVGWSDTSPRGASDLSREERAAAENLLLLCRNCHKPADAKGVVGRYTVEVLLQRKREHEDRVRFLTEIGADRRAHVIRVVGPIRDSQPQLSYETVLEATTAAGLYPAILQGSYGAEEELDLRQQRDDASESFATAAREIDALLARVHEGVRRDEISRLAVFGFARIPILIHLGARLDDKVETRIFQRQRTDSENAWRWPADPLPPPTFSVTKSPGSSPGVVLVLNLSGTIPTSDLPSTHTDQTRYEIAPEPPAAAGPTLIDSPAALESFEQAARSFFAIVERDHSDIETVSVFAAVPVSCAITLGRVLMPNVSPSLTIFDRDENGRFFEALEVRR